VELARAEAHLDFARVELRSGDFLEARREVSDARLNAKAALQKSSAECGPRPKPRDSDGDGVPDRDDKCPNEPGPAALGGCPDKDGDGIIDAEDKCPSEPGPKETGGCPDKDGDTVADKDDRCPDVPGPPENQGCPQPKLIVVTKEKIELKQKIHFAFKSSEIMRDSFAMLNEIVEVLRARPQVQVRIEGHTDSVGTPKRNQKLSEARAAAVRGYLIDKGIGPERLEARGYGQMQPIADNRTAIGREQNRRVEFIITAGGEGDPPAK
jgi:outer membrane protein OmpA-like peptidoglycan-associated protein